MNNLPKDGWFVKNDQSQKFTNTVGMFLNELDPMFLEFTMHYYGVDGLGNRFGTSAKKPTESTELTIEQFNLLVKPVCDSDHMLDAISYSFGIDFGKPDSHNDVYSNSLIEQMKNYTFKPIDIDFSKLNKDLGAVMIKLPKHSDAKVCELLDELHSEVVKYVHEGNYQINYSPEVLTKFKIDKGLIKETKPELKVGKWLKDTDNGFIFFVTTPPTDNVTAKGYGFDDCGEWFDDAHIGYTEHSEATDKEVLEALTKEAEKKGYKGVFMLRSRGTGLACNNVEIMLNGVWAEIVETVNELTIPEIEKLTGLDNIKIIK